jgi:hypothetical protein
VTEITKLGTNVRLSGFQDESAMNMAVIEKKISSYVDRMEELHDFKNVDITLKKVHAHPDGKGGKNEIHVRMNAEKLYTTEVTDFDVLVSLDKALKKIIAASEQ